MLALIVPALSSNPGAFQTLYLDFDGSAPFLWDGAGSGVPYVVRGPSPDNAPIAVPAFTTDADALNFSATELTNIRNIFDWVAEKFSPFTINVTTMDPGIVEDSRNMTCIIGGSASDWLGQTAGGVASLGGFVDGGENTCFAFSVGVSAATIERFVGETIAHEAGHLIGLQHQRQGLPGGGVDEYFDGDSLRAPIMGGSSNNTTARGVWWWSANPDPNWPAQNSPDADQQDLVSLTQDAPQRLFYKSDDYNVNTGAMVFDAAGVLVRQKGTIERNGDVDGFSFQATGARASFQINNAAYGGMLAPTAAMRISGSSTMVPVNVFVTNTGATIEATNLTPGVSYVLLVSGRDSYGSIGQYTIDGSRQQFASLDPVSGRVSVGGFLGNNNVTLRTFGGSLIVEDSVNGGPTTSQSFALSSVSGVNVFLGGGDDILNIANLRRADGSTLDVVSNLGGGFDILRLGATGNSFETFTVRKFAISWTSGTAAPSRIFDTNTDQVELIGTNDHDVFNIESQAVYGTLKVFGNFGDDRLNLGPAVVAANLPSVVFDGGSGTDTLEMDGLSLVDAQQFIVFNNIVQRFVPGSPFAAETQFGTAVETLRIRGGSGSDTFKVLGLRVGMTAFLLSADGDDQFLVGDSSNPIQALPFSANVRGIVNIDPGNGQDRLVVDDTAWLSGANYTIDTFTGLKNTFVNNAVQYAGTLERLDFYSRGGETTTVTGPTLNEVHLFNGAGNGMGNLIVDERSGLATRVNNELYADRIVSKNTIGTPPVIFYSGYEALTLYTNSNTHAINVYGTSPDITTQTTLITGSGSDTVTIYPHGPDLGAIAASDSGPLTAFASEPTIVTGLGYFGGGGTDSLVIDDSGSAAPVNYLVNNAGGAGTANVWGFGPSGVGAWGDVESIVVLAGAGGDTFAVDSYLNASTLSLYGGDGDDALAITPTSQNLAANFAVGKTLTFDGGEGLDSFAVHNEANPSGNGYSVGDGRLRIDSRLGFPGFTATFPHIGVEVISAVGGPQLDFFAIQETYPGTFYDLDGGLGAINDEYYLGAQFNSRTDLVRGGVRVNGAGGGADTVTVYDSSDTIGRTLHIGNGYVGRGPGNDLFGPGGYLQHNAIAGGMTINLGSGDDAVFALPSDQTPITIRDFSSATPGDTLYAALASAEDYQITGAPASGNISSTNLKTLSYTGFESGPNVDDVAPYVVTQGYEETGPAALAIGFSEDVLNSPNPLSTSFLELINITTGEQISADVMLLVYDASLDVGVFTFPGLANGALPAGEYSARFIAGASDTFGNVMDDQTAFFFTPTPPLAGDYNSDRVVDLSDYDIWKLTYGGAVGIVGEGADGNSDGYVDAADYTVWRDHLGETVSPFATTSSARSFAGTSSPGAEPAEIAETPTLQGSRVTVLPPLEIGRAEQPLRTFVRDAHATPQQLTRHPAPFSLLLKRGDESDWHAPRREGFYSPAMQDSRVEREELNQIFLALDLAFSGATELDFLG